MVSRRTVLAGLGAAGVAGAGYVAVDRMRVAPERQRMTLATTGRQPNIILVTSDQERSWDQMPPGFIETHCPARARLAARSMNFTRAQSPSQLCSTARGTIYTGRHPQNSSVWENVPIPYATDMKEAIPTMGTLFQDAGYQTAYCGKWHLSRLGQRGEPYAPERVAEIVSQAGFDIALTEKEVDGPFAGYRYDSKTVEQALAQAARRGEDGKPLFMAVNLVNPHDIMYYSSGDAMTASRKVDLQPIMRPPRDPLYDEDLGYDVIGPWGPATRAGKPPAVAEYVRAYETIFGEMAYDDERVARDFQNYYWNAIRDCDRSLALLIDGLEDMGALDDTIVVFTSDHGEFLGAHGLRGKGVTAYREASAIPLMVSAPDGPRGETSDALVSLVDLVPTLLGLAGIDTGPVITEAQLAGQDLSKVAMGEAGPGPRDEDGVLLHWTSLAFIDHKAANAFGDVASRTGLGQAYAYWQMQRNEMADAADKRGQMRGVFDGRYKFARYFAPNQHHRPDDAATLTAMNDLELYDVEADPSEIVNLAADPASAPLVANMNQKLNRLIDREIGVDDGSFLPGFARA
ncbi:sulfatase-like hydrolase/transferase [Erythrobacter rubeus]|uniref:Sulfatase-like hydrolase/transferase n=1 Tax=Erythrobacter rubeus TaxID=2760803 RepID=A0ABR8KMS7_9SPHN|nr:sulfatase-like hydrolase/transferase [Erythrobacter rubeus]MBD2841884.1 sulfatase-like hydrolase/transferase [Erythrobacter rubeus]